MDKLLGAYIFISDRLREPSSHNAVSYLLGLAGLTIDSPVVQAILLVFSVGFGAAGFFLKEAKPLTKL